MPSSGLALVSTLPSLGGTTSLKSRRLLALSLGLRVSDQPRTSCKGVSVVPGPWRPSRQGPDEEWSGWEGGVGRGAPGGSGAGRVG